MIVMSNISILEFHRKFMCDDFPGNRVSTEYTCSIFEKSLRVIGYNLAFRFRIGRKSGIEIFDCNNFFQDFLGK